MSSEPKTIKVRYFASMRDWRGVGEESVVTNASSAAELYAELAIASSMPQSPDWLRVAINGAYSDLDAPLHDGDELVWIPPVAGG